MARPKGKSVPPETIAKILSGMTDNLSVSEILKFAETSTTTFYNVVKDFPLWSHRYKKEE